MKLVVNSNRPDDFNSEKNMGDWVLACFICCTTDLQILECVGEQRPWTVIVHLGFLQVVYQRSVEEMLIDSKAPVQMVNWIKSTFLGLVVFGQLFCILKSSVVIFYYP